MLFNIAPNFTLTKTKHTIVLCKSYIFLRAYKRVQLMSLKRGKILLHLKVFYDVDGGTISS